MGKLKIKSSSASGRAHGAAPTVFCFLFSVLCLLFSPPTHASPMKMVFFYPGGQGSQEQAQPILDSFSDALSKASGGEIQAQITYISDSQEGQKFIQEQKPEAGILSLDVFLRQRQPWGMEVIAKSLQLPSGDGQDQYFILGQKGTSLPAENFTVYSSRPLDASFVREKLFPHLKGSLPVQATTNILGKLRNIGSGTESGFALVDQFEYANISRLKIPWATQLEILASSEKISSAPFVVFKNNISSEKISRLQNALLKLSQNAEAKETLATLRLKGFKKANGSDLGT